MAPERRRRIDAILQRATAAPDADRASIVDEACGDDEALRVEVETLLLADSPAGATTGAPPTNLSKPPPAKVAPGEIVGRRLGPYLVVRELGHGGMGAVYLATRADDAYRKEVAVKILRHGLETEAALARFRAERQILADLEHPNIARLLDGGNTESKLPYLVMEYVRGRALLDHAASLGLVEKLRLFLHVTSAVEYAHDKLVVHRDIKPANILVTDEGAPKLLDFGIAKLLADDGAPPTDATHTLAFTPAYASPEQVRGEAATIATDVYALGALLYEMLSGARAQIIRSLELAEVLRVVCEELPAPPSAVATSAIAKALRGDLDTIVLKALQKEPARRYASVAAFSEDVRRYLARRPVLARKDTLLYRASKFVRRNRAAVAATAVVAVGLTGALAVTTLHRAGPALCRGARDRFSSAWGEERAREVRASFTGIAKAYASDSLRAVEQRLDGYADAWSRMYTEACEATRMRGDQSPELLDLRMACLEERRQQASALVDVLAHADDDVAQRAAQATEALPGLARCADAQTLRASLAVPGGAQRDEVTRVRAELAVASALHASGKFASGLSRAKDALTAARALAYAPLVAEAAHTTGVLMADAGNARGAVETLAEAARAAAEGHHDSVSTEALIDLARIYSDKLHELDKAWAFAQPVEWSMVRFGTEPALEARLFDVQAYILEGRGKHTEAAPYFERSLAIREKVFGPSSPTAARALLALGENRRLQLRYDDAMTSYRRALTVFEEALGHNHPNVALTLNNMGTALVEAGHPAEALPLSEQALAIRRAALGPDHPDVARTLSNLANITLALGRLDPALAYSKEALAVKERTLGPEHPSLAFTLVVLADVELQRAELDLALAHTERALAIRTKALGPDHAYVMETLIFLGRVRLVRREPRSALEPLERAVALAEKSSDDDPAMRGEARSLLGRALWESRGDRARARSLLHAGRADLVRSGDRGAVARRDLEAWQSVNPVE